MVFPSRAYVIVRDEGWHILNSKAMEKVDELSDD